MLVLPSITAWQFIAHALGDYVLQSDWMANEKTKKSFAALVHCIFYTLPFFLFFKPSWEALGVIAGSHFIIDRFRLARYVCYLKNFLAPPKTKTELQDSFDSSGSIHVRQTKWRINRWWRPWSECKGTGYPDDNIPYLSIWLLIITDNLMHIIINAFALAYL